MFASLGSSNSGSPDLGSPNLHKLAFFFALVPLLLATACGGGTHNTVTLSNLPSRVLASQSVASPGAFPGLVVINGANDTVAHIAELSAGGSPGLMVTSPTRATVLSFDSSNNSIAVINSNQEREIGTIPLPAPSISMAATTDNNAYVAVPSAPFNTGQPPGAILALNLASPSIAETISVPDADYVIASPTANELIAIPTPTSNQTGTITIVSQLLVDTGNPLTTVVAGFDHPAWAVISADGSTAYVMNCGPECGGIAASVQVVNLISPIGPTLVGAPIPVDGATIGWLGTSDLYVVGTPTASASNSSPNNSCAGETTAATICGRVDVIDLTTLAVVGSAVITNGYHDRIDMSVNGQLFVGAYNCTNVGDVNNPIGEVRGCLSIYNTNAGTVTIPPDNGDVTGFQSLTTQYVEFVAEGGNLRVYDTQIDSLLLDEYIETGTITISGQVIDVKAIDFF